MSVTTAALAPCGVWHVSVRTPFAPIEAAPDQPAVYVVFWREGRPAGAKVLLAGELPVPAPAVPALAADAVVGTLLEAALPAAGEAPPVSVVVATRDRPADLRRCLASIVRCDPAPAEVIVVDNAAAGGGETAAVVAGFPALRYLHEPRPGLSHARNTGVRAARSPIVAFTDDDVEVAPDWLGRLTMAFADPAVACVTGSVLPARLDSAAACLFEFEAGGLGKKFTRRRIDPGFLRAGWRRAPAVWNIGAGANMAIRRAAFAEVGLFDPRLGAGASGCSEDSELWFRLLRAGHVCFYDPAAVVFHHHRDDRAALTRQLRAYTRGHVVALFVQFAQDRRPGHLIRAFAVLPWYYLKLAVHALRTRDPGLLAVVRPQFLGCLEGPFHALAWLRREGPPRLEIQESQ
jgi:GT2 family glycosyltransferase